MIGLMLFLGLIVGCGGHAAGQDATPADGTKPLARHLMLDVKACSVNGVSIGQSTSELAEALDDGRVELVADRGTRRCDSHIEYADSGVVACIIGNHVRSLTITLRSLSSQERSSVLAMMTPNEVTELIGRPNYEHALADEQLYYAYATGGCCAIVRFEDAPWRGHVMGAAEVFYRGMPPASDAQDTPVSNVDSLDARTRLQ